MFERQQGSKTKTKNQETHILVYDRHLGGCSLTGDGATYYPRMWAYMVNKFSFKSAIDIGCGAGHSTEYFQHLGLEIHGVEGCKEAAENCLIDKKFIKIHDYENDGAYVPHKDYDLGWSCEFVEHVEKNCMQNFFETFKKCKYLAITYAYPGQGGHHHVNEQPEQFWLNEISKIGFTYDAETTAELREIAKQDCEVHSPFYTSHFINRGLFFKRNY
jgi:SAM-dependent methyltransferase